MSLPQGDRPERGRRGATLATVLLVATLMLVLAFTLASTSIFHLNFSSRVSNRAKARDLAESALSLGITKLLAAHQHGQELPQELEFTRHDGHAYLTFDASQAADHQLAYSLDNFEGDQAVAGYEGQVVPAFSAHLVARGTSGGVTVDMETVIYRPPFPYAIATDGTFRSEGSLVVGSLEDMGDLDDLSHLAAADVVANASIQSSLILDGDAWIAGDLQSAGGIEVSEETEVRGEIIAFREATHLPAIRIEDYDPAASGANEVRDLTDPRVQDPVLGGLCRRQGDFTVNGRLILDGGVLYVDGDLLVEQGIHGKGAVFVTGETTISGSSSLRSDNVAALLSKGDVTLSGNSRDSSFFQGLVYTEGNLEASNLTIVGVLLTVGESSVTTRDTRVIHQPEYTELVLSQEPQVVLHFNADTAEYRGIEPPGSNGNTPDGVIRVQVGRDQDGYLVYEAESGLRFTGAQDIEEAVRLMEQLLSIQVPQFQSLQENNDRQIRSLIRNFVDNGRPNSTSAPILDLTLNRFLPLSDQTRILYWRERPRTQE